MAELLAAGPDETVLELRVHESSGKASLKPIEIVKAVLEVEASPTAFVRVGCWSRHASSAWRDPLELPVEAIEV